MHKAVKVMVTGRVQGVGFRPFIYALAHKYRITGSVQNNLDCVTIVAEGEEHALLEMVEEIRSSPPPLSKIDELHTFPIAPSFHHDFTILSSGKSGNTLPWIAADAAICNACLEELSDPGNKRYQYPFINCTQCGPRYTITSSLPYDRPNTTMAAFDMCPSCRAEYEDPTDRRHHAQPICCPECGPILRLYDRSRQMIVEDKEAVSLAVEHLKQGKIIGIKGIGGYHLACNAHHEKAVARLRIKKSRPQRPFAVMAGSLETARELCYLSEQEEEMLTSPEMPIVILRKKGDWALPQNLSPGLSTLGVMLPYTPLHALLFQDGHLECLVMTSANPSGHPILYEDASFEQVLEMCDYVLTHDRNIFLPIDDSVFQGNGEHVLPVRRARGFVPDPLQTGSDVDAVIALGGHQKNTFAIGRGQTIMVGPHIGDLQNEEMIHFFRQQLAHYQKWLGVQGSYIAIDQHPLYATTLIAQSFQGRIIPVQHHHAHLVSCMVENKVEHPCIGIILDGTGYGEDGCIWGFEFLYGNARSVERLAHLQYTPLPGGEKAVEQPWRNAAAMLLHHWGEEGKQLAMTLFPEREKEIQIIKRMIAGHINSPMAGTCGRLFDAVSAILGICEQSTYDGEASIKLSDYMMRGRLEGERKTYPFHLTKDSTNQFQLDLSPMVYQIIQDKLSNMPIRTIIQAFHDTIVSCCVETVQKLVEERPDLNRSVVLSGGSFQNRYLAKEIQGRLESEGFTVYTHQLVPCNDGGLSVGQLMIAARAASEKKRTVE
ncbi:MAG: carbamoyltransferase HypF [Lysinibacillus sp.]